MSEHVLGDWGGFEPETQKALRFIALLDQGAAKQIANAIAHEYIARTAPEPVPMKKPLVRKNALSEDDRKVLRILERATPQMEFETAVAISGLSAEQFSACLDKLVAQRYLQGDAFWGYARTRKRLKPSEAEWDAAIGEIEDPYSRRVARVLHEQEPGWVL